MTTTETGRMGRRGTFVIPAALRRQFGLEEGTLILAEATEQGILLRPAVAMAVETYSPKRRAAFLLENVTDASDYRAARAAVVAMGLDPDQIQHAPPGKSKR